MLDAAQGMMLCRRDAVRGKKTERLRERGRECWPLCFGEEIVADDGVEGEVEASGGETNVHVGEETGNAWVVGEAEEGRAGKGVGVRRGLVWSVFTSGSENGDGWPFMASEITRSHHERSTTTKYCIGCRSIGVCCGWRRYRVAIELEYMESRSQFEALGLGVQWRVNR